MSDLDDVEAGFSKILLKLDFSSPDTKHREQLWRELSEQTNARLLSDDELDAIAAAGSQTLPQKPEDWKPNR